MATTTKNSSQPFPAQTKFVQGGLFMGKDGWVYLGNDERGLVCIFPKASLGTLYLPSDLADDQLVPFVGSVTLTEE